VYLRQEKPSEVKNSSLVQTCSHIANGFKHFTADAARHKSVAGTWQTGGYWLGRYFTPRYWEPRYWASGALVIELQGDAAKKLGGGITAVELAERVLGFWENRPELRRRE
jgi:hypothetical protein